MVLDFTFSDISIEIWIGYILFEEKTKSLIAIDPGDYLVAKNNIELIEFEKKAKLKCILSTHHHSNHNDSTAKFKAERPDLDVIIGINYFSEYYLCNLVLIKETMELHKLISLKNMMRLGLFLLEMFVYVFSIHLVRPMIAVHLS